MVVAITGARCSTTAATESWRPELSNMLEECSWVPGAAPG
jgi:hypothetical protein